jgi:hypothetical protein
MLLMYNGFVVVDSLNSCIVLYLKMNLKIHVEQLSYWLILCSRVFFKRVFFLIKNILK